MRKLLGRLYVWVRFGKITSRSVEFLNGHEAEIEYCNAKGCVVGLVNVDCMFDKVVIEITFLPTHVPTNVEYETLELGE